MTKSRRFCLWFCCLAGMGLLGFVSTLAIPVTQASGIASIQSTVVPLIPQTIIASSLRLDGSPQMEIMAAAPSTGDYGTIEYKFGQRLLPVNYVQPGVVLTRQIANIAPVGTEIKFTAATASQGSCSVTPTSVVCNVGTVAAGVSVRIDMAMEFPSNTKYFETPGLLTCGYCTPTSWTLRHSREIRLVSTDFLEQSVQTLEWNSLNLSTVDGNVVRIQNKIQNLTYIADEDEYYPVALSVYVYYWDAAQDKKLNLFDNNKGYVKLELAGENPSSNPPPEPTSLEAKWDTDGYAWDVNGGYIDPRVIIAFDTARENVHNESDLRQVLVVPRPVILVHGLGSNPEKAWGGYEANLTSINPNWQAQKLKYDLGTDLGSSASTGTSPEANATLLDTNIKSFRKALNAWHVDVIAHSMGGLITRAYVHSLMSNDVQDESGRPIIRNAFLLATPSLGSPVADALLSRSKKIGSATRLTYAALADFNRVNTDTHGVEFITISAEHGDEVVDAPSAMGAGVDQLKSSDNHLIPCQPNYNPWSNWRDCHGYVTSAEVFNTYIKPLLAPAPPLIQQPNSQLNEASVNQLMATAAVKTPAPRLLITDKHLILTPGQVVVENVSVNSATRLGISLTITQNTLVEISNPSNTIVQTISLTTQPDFLGDVWFDAPQAGTWQVKFTNQGTADVDAIYGAWLEGNPVSLVLNTSHPQVFNSLRLAATFKNGSTLLTGANVTLQIVGDNYVNNLVMADDGQNGAEIAGDAAYTTQLANLNAGLYSLAITAQSGDIQRILVTTIQIVSADLSISQTPSVNPVIIGDNLIYTLNAANAGPSGVGDVVLRDTLPAGVTFVSALPSQGSCTRATNLITCPLGGVAAGMTPTVQVTVKVNANAPDELNNAAVITSNDYDPNTANNTSTSAIIVQLPASSVPELLEPSDGSTVAQVQPIFRWKGVSGAAGYEIQLSAVDIENGTIFASPATQFTPPGPLLPATYQWRVRATNATGVASPWSLPFSVTITSTSDAAPSRNYFAQSPVVLTWSPMSWATGYEVQISTNDKFSGSPVYAKDDLGSTDLQVTVDNLEPSSYYWRVRGKDANGDWGDWSDVDIFLLDKP